MIAHLLERKPSYIISPDLYVVRVEESVNATSKCATAETHVPHERCVVCMNARVDDMYEAHGRLRNVWWQLQRGNRVTRLMGMDSQYKEFETTNYLQVTR